MPRLYVLVTVAILCQACGSTPAVQSAEKFAPWLSDSIVAVSQPQASQEPRDQQEQQEKYVVVTVHNWPVSLSMRSGASSRDYGTEEDYGPSPRARAQIHKIAHQYNLREINAWPIRALSVHCVVFAAQKHVDMAILLALLRQDLRVESAQTLQKFMTSSTNDSRPPNAEPYAHLQANLVPMEVMQAHRVTRGDGVRVAVIDTGIDVSHPDLKGRVVEQRDYAGTGSAALGAAGPQSLPPEKHGTAVAGIIAARDDNHVGIVGVAPAAKILALRACWPSEANGARAVCNTFTLAQALSAAIELRADVVNLSLSGPSDPLLTRLVNAGIERGIAYVGAMPAPSAPLGFPANVPGVIRVSSTSTSGTVASDSLQAPGEEQLTLTPAGGYDFLSGSSLAAANVSGGVALLLARRPRLKSAAVNEALSASMRGAAGVNLCAALVKVDKTANCERE